MTYNFEDAVKEENQIERDFTGVSLCSRPVTHTQKKKDFEMRFGSEKKKITGQTFIFINSTFQMLYFIGRDFAEVQIQKKWNWPYLLNFIVYLT